MEIIQSKLILPLFISFCVILTSTQAVKVKYCDNSNYDVKVKGVEITPNPVVRGKPATFNISATAGEAISEGELEIDVSYFRIPIHKEDHDLCEETSCPVSKGDFELSHSQLLPGFTPPGSYSLTMKMFGANKELLTCISFDFRIGAALSVADS